MGAAPVRELDAATGFLAWLASSPFDVGKHLSKRDRHTFAEAWIDGDAAVCTTT